MLQTKFKILDKKNYQGQMTKGLYSLIDGMETKKKMYKMKR